MVSASEISLRWNNNVARHVHTSGSFTVQLHASRVDSCCELRNGDQLTPLPPPHAAVSRCYSVTDSFLAEFTNDVRTVVGASLFASVVAHHGGSCAPAQTFSGDKGCTENTFFVVECLTTTTTTSSLQQQQQEGGSVPYLNFRLRVKDSRISAALQTAVRKHSFVVLTHCRVMMSSASLMANQPNNGSTQRLMPQQMAPPPQEEGATAACSPDRMNMDDDLLQAVELAVSEHGGATTPSSSSSSSSSAKLLFSLLREQRRQLSIGAAAPHQQQHLMLDFMDLERLLLEHKDFISTIKAACVYTEPGSGVASPFLCFVWCLFMMPVTHHELCKTLAVHSNRYLRAAAMYYARYLYPLELLAPVFAPSMDDGTVIACAGDMSETRAMKDLARKLLLEDELDEAWLPTYSKWWIQVVIEPTIRLMADHKEAAERAAVHSGRVQVATATTGMGEESSGSSKRGREEASGGPKVVGAGRTTLMGFRSSLELALFVDQARMLATGDTLQQMLRAAAERSDAQDDADVGEDGDEEAAWARRQHHQQLVDKNGPTAAPASLPQERSSRSHTAELQPAAPSPSSAASVDVRRIAASHAQKAILELLGPSGAARALRRSDPVYLRI